MSIINDAAQAVARLIHENARLRSKNRNYRLQLKQLTRAHIVTLRELERAQARENVSLRPALVEWFPDEPPCKVDAEITFNPR